MSTTTLVTLEDLERMPEDGMHREILHGELIELPPAQFEHSLIAHRIQDALGHFVKSHGLGQVFIELGYQLFRDVRSWLQPDVSYIRLARVREVSVSGYFQGPPDLAVEIISPSERAHDVEAKVSAYLKAGSSAVWVVYPNTQTIRVFNAGGGEATLSAGGKLSAPALFPGWELPVTDVFAG